jgi:hypothetical protein
MKQSIVLFILLCAAPLFAQDKSPVTVKDSTVINGVVVVNIQEAGKPLELQCNQSAPRCRTPQSGNYWMVRLPKNHGIYDCADVDLYAQSGNSQGQDDILGEYCINEK